MEFKGTKGPIYAAELHILKEGKSGSIGQSFILNREEDYRGKSIPDIEALANAKLWAASPDLLALAQLVHEICSGKTMPAEKQVAEMEAKAAVVISKALTL